jgi:hypothetical protein
MAPLIVIFSSPVSFGLKGPTDCHFPAGAIGFTDRYALHVDRLRAHPKIFGPASERTARRNRPDRTAYTNHQ